MTFSGRNKKRERRNKRKINRQGIKEIEKIKERNKRIKETLVFSAFIGRNIND